MPNDVDEHLGGVFKLALAQAHLDDDQEAIEALLALAKSPEAGEVGISPAQAQQQPDQ